MKTFVIGKEAAVAVAVAAADFKATVVSARDAGCIAISNTRSPGHHKAALTSDGDSGRVWCGAFAWKALGTALRYPAVLERRRQKDQASMRNSGFTLIS